MPKQAKLTYELVAKTIDNLIKKLNPYMSQTEQDVYVDNYIYSNNI